MDISTYRYPITVKNCFADQRVFVAVISASSYFEKRQMIRQTWFRNLDNTFYGFAFILGLTENTTIQHSIEEESLTFGDIIQMNFLDDYNNLTLKSIGLLHWLSISCPKISYILKCDDDVYVNVPNFSTFLASDVISSSKQLAIYGNFNNNRPMRSGKWSLTTDEWPWSTFPFYVSGGSILITGNAVIPLLEASRVVPFLWIEDVYLNGLLTEKANVNLYDVPKFFITDITQLDDDVDFLRESVSWLTDYPEQMSASHKATEDLYDD